MSSSEQVDVERGAQPAATAARAPLVPDRALIVITLALAAVLLIAVGVSLAFWHTPATHPIELPIVGQA
ncbi:MAG: hypothetical protein ABWX96_19640 [Propionibacteriaceae bacterium]